ncbi:hypothetical protein GCM10011584_30560 [Nocardioides phosphati]|uniref:ABC transporter permease n=1 Tax=Nocardioides phosphati TaxID=1867775 RepID=A0ABQ2NE13_9ACTN|nr:ABC transporter permease [Nocardioides phosphati]GGO92961.1 hypothetical protein GCM10011584_30560 [Nocardioides phosphati]
MLLPLAAPTAGGASLHDVLIASGIAFVYFAVTGWLLIRERTGHRTLLGRGLDWFGEKVGLPAWAAGPFAIMPFVLLTAGFGVYWDVPVHMQRGRDNGAFASPAHYPIYLVLLGLLNIALVIMAMAKDPLPRRTLKIAPGWRVPFSSLILFFAGSIAVTGFPLDDLWHILFGQDVTEWGPTHVLMIGGAITSPLCLPLLLAEAKQVGARAMNNRAGRWLMLTAMALCIVPFAFLMEFDLGIPQFPAATQGIIFSVTLGMCCVMARLWFGPGGSLGVAAFWQFAHWFLVAVIAALPNVITIQFLTAIPFAILVELVALALSVDRRKNIVMFALVSGALGGSLGYYFELLWSKDHMPVPQPFGTGSWPLLIAVSAVAGVAGSLLGVYIYRRCQQVAGDVAEGPEATETRSFRYVGLAGFAIFLGLMGVFAPPTGTKPVHAVLTYDHVTGGQTACTSATEQCLANVTITFKGDDPTTDAVWFTALAWQGYPNAAIEPTAKIPTDPYAGVPGIVRTPMVATGTPGQYRTKYPLPLYGHWKSMIRLHTGTTTMMAFPVFFNDDPAVTGPRGREIRIANGGTVASQYEPHLLQRERRDDIPAWLWVGGNVVVFSLWVIVLLLFGWCYNRAAGMGRLPAPVREKVTA